MSSKVESSRNDDEDFSCEILLRDIEEISKALYMHKSPQDAFSTSYRRDAVYKTGISESKSDVITRNPLRKDKKSSIWKWKPLKALSHIRSQRFECCFFLHVHTIEGLPPNFNNLDLHISWKKKADILSTRTSRVSLGKAQFEETLMHRCTIHKGRSGPHSGMNYKPKLFLLQASVIGQQTIDIWSHWVDVSRLLPLTLEDSEGTSGKWTTSFNLSGKAKGATLNASFGFSISSDDSFEPGYFVKVPDVVMEKDLNHFADLDLNKRPNQLHSHNSVPGTSLNSNSLEEIFTNKRLEIPLPVALLHQKFDEANLKLLQDPIPKSLDGITGNHYDDFEFDVYDLGINVSIKDQIKPEKCGSLRFDNIIIETIDVAEIFEGEEEAFNDYAECDSNIDVDNYDVPERGMVDFTEQKDNDACVIDELDLELYDLLATESAEVDSFLDSIVLSDQGKYMKSRSGNRGQTFMESLCLDDGAVAVSIENDFLNMLGIDLSQDRLFDQDSLASGNPILDSDVLPEQKACSCSTPTGFRKVVFNDYFDLSLSAQLDRSCKNKNAEELENLETESLMHEWGLTDRAFQYSPRVRSGGFGSPVYTPVGEPSRLPSIEEGLGPIIQTKDGGFLRSMNPLLFRNANNGARLVMQVSAPVVLPSAMGAMIMEMLQLWASVGVEKMCIHSNELMPLEDVTGKTIRQFLADSRSMDDAFNRWTLECEADAGVESIDEKELVDAPTNNISSDYVSLKDLVPMLLANIECLLVEGLKIQSGIPDVEAPSSIRIQHFGNSSCLQVNKVDELIKKSVSLEEWLRLNSGEHEYTGNDKNDSEQFTTHCANPMESVFSMEDEGVILNSGNFADNFTMGFKVQLRDPLRNHEMVGSAMLVMVQVDRVFFEQNKSTIDQPMFKVSEAHLAGVNIVHVKNQLWGTSRQQQSGSRWLFSSGMAKINAVVKSSSGLMREALQEDVLWSIAVPSHGETGTCNDQIALNVHLRNPDIIFPTVN